MTKSKNVTMCKSGCKDIPVNPDAVERFKEDGWVPADGSTPAPVVEDDGLTKAEKNKEIDAAGEVARKAAVKSGASKAEVTEAVDAAKAEAANALEE